MTGVSHPAMGRRAFVLAGLVLCGSFSLAGCKKVERPVDLDLSTSKATEKGLYRGAFEPQGSGIAVNRIHSWTLRVTDATGAPVDQATITVDGGMPEHGHGLPTRPEVTRGLGQGSHLVEGMKFNMPGWWVVQFKIDGPAGPDTLTFNLVL